MDFAFGCIDKGLLLPPLLLFEEAGGSAHRGGNGFPKHARRFILRFEPCSNHVNLASDSPLQVLKIRNTHYRIFLLSCATRNCNSHCQSCDDEPRSQIFRNHMGRPGVLSDGTCTSIPGTSITVAIPIFKTGKISWFASVDATGLDPPGFWALCLLCILMCVFAIRHLQE